jgi:hypothetical protein
MYARLERSAYTVHAVLSVLAESLQHQCSVVVRMCSVRSAASSYYSIDDAVAMVLAVQPIVVKRSC